MTVTVEKKENNEVKLIIEIDSETSSEEYNKACKRLSQKVTVPGFRQGKAPKNILEKYVGIAALQREVLEGILPDIFQDAIDKNNFDLITPPDVESYEFAPDNSLKITAKLELRPEVKIDKYKGLEIEIEEYKNPENIVEKELENIQTRFASLNDVTERKSNNTDLVNMDFTGYADGEEIKGGAAKNYVLDLGHSNFIPGFAEQLTDRNVGDEFTIKVKFPDQYHDEKLQGKDAEFNIKINAIKERILPELNDELAQKVNPDIKTLEDLKTDIKNYTENAAKNENKRRSATAVFETLLEKTDIKIQDSMINREIQAIMGEFKQRVNMQGGDFDKMLETEGHEKVYAQLREEAVKRIKTSLIVGEIAKSENISITQAEIQGKIAEMAAIYRTTPDNLIAEMQKNTNIIQLINQQVITEKITEFLVNNAKVSYKK